MKNLIKAEMYRFRTTPLIWGLVIAYAVLSLINGCLTGLVAGNAPWLVEIKGALVGTLGGEQSTFSAMMTLMQEMMTGSVNSFNDFIRASVGSNLLMMLSIFVGVFCLSQKSSGYIKNMMPLKSRSQILSANLFTTLIFTIILDVVYVGTVSATWGLFFNGTMFSIQTLWYLGLMFIITVADALFIYSVCDFFKNPKVGMIIAVIYTAGISKYFYKIIDIIISALGQSFKVESVLPLGLLSAVNPEETLTTTISLVMAAIYGIASIIYLYRVNNKRDY